MTTHRYFALAKHSKLTLSEMDEMSIGFVIGHVQEYFDMLNPNKKQKARKATQVDINMLKGH